MKLHLRWQCIAVVRWQRIANRLLYLPGRLCACHGAIKPAVVETAAKTTLSFVSVKRYSIIYSVNVPELQTNRHDNFTSLSGKSFCEFTSTVVQCLPRFVGLSTTLHGSQLQHSSPAPCTSSSRNAHQASPPTRSACILPGLAFMTSFFNLPATPQVETSATNSLSLSHSASLPAASRSSKHHEVGRLWE